MVAARRFALQLQETGVLNSIRRVEVTLLGSLAFTGRGHGSDRAIVLGLANELPEEYDASRGEAIWRCARDGGQLSLAAVSKIPFSLRSDLLFDTLTPAKHHPNTLQLRALDVKGECLFAREYYSIGGGFVLDEHEARSGALTTGCVTVPQPFGTCDELVEACQNTGKSIHEIVLENERALRSQETIKEGMRRIWSTMSQSIDAGCNNSGTLPGWLKIQRRAPQMKAKLLENEPWKNVTGNKRPDPLSALDWINLWALAVNEENAAGGKVVTAPTNGAAGIVPAVYAYYKKYHETEQDSGLFQFFLTATAIANLFKNNASISGAEVGCQGEVGVASSMAAAGLTAALGGNVKQVENAAEIAMEHSLGLTCDPVGGLVQIPCIERNAIGAVKAVDATRLALYGDGKHRVSLDQVINTMRQTGADMNSIYKETSLGGLAVNIIEC